MSDRELYLGAMAGEYEGELPAPSSRSLKWMAKILGQEVETEPVQSPEEAYLKKIAESGGGGGGNPNYVETIQGTLAAPFGDYYVPELMQGLSEMSMSLVLTVTLGNQTVNLFGADLGYLRFCLTIASGGSWQRVAEVSYSGSTGALIDALYDLNGDITDLSSMADRIATELTIIHHPLPDDEDDGE